MNKPNFANEGVTWVIWNCWLDRATYGAETALPDKVCLTPAARDLMLFLKEKN